MTPQTTPEIHRSQTGKLHWIRGIKLPGWVRELCVFILFLGLPVIFFPDMALEGRFPTGGDITLFTYPNFHFLSQQLHQGGFPFWNPYSFSGTPFFSDPQSAATHLPLLLSAAFIPANWGFPINLLIHFFMAGWFTYLFSRRLSLSRPASILAGMCYMLGQYSVTKVLVTSIFYSLPFLPLTLFAIERTIQKRTIGSLIISSICLTLLLLCGYPQGIYLTLLTGCIYLLIRIAGEIFILTPKTQINVGHRVIGNILITFFIAGITTTLASWNFPGFISSWVIGMITTGIGVLLFGYILFIRYQSIEIQPQPLISLIILLLASLLGLGLAAVQLYPSLLFQQETLRAGLNDFGYFRIINLSLQFKNVLQDLFLGGGMGDPVISGYIGTIPLLLIILSFVLPKTSTENNPVSRVFWALILFSLSLVFLEPYCTQNVFRHIPGFKTFFVTHRYIVIYTLAISIIAGLALDKLLNWKFELDVIPLNIWKLTGILLAIFLLLNSVGLQNQTWKLIPGILVILLIVLCPGRMFHPWLIVIAIATITLTELWQPTPDYNRLLAGQKASIQYPEYDLVNFLSRDSSLYRYCSIESSQLPEPTFNPPAATQKLLSNTAMVYQLQDAQGYNPMYLKNYRMMVDLANNGKPQRPPYNDNWHYAALNPEINSFTDMMNIKYFISDSPLELKNSRLVSSNGLFVYEATNVQPRAWMTHRALVTQSNNLAAQWMRQDFFNPQNTLILHENVGKLTEKRSNFLGKTDIKLPANRSIQIISDARDTAPKVQFILDGTDLLDTLPEAEDTVDTASSENQDILIGTHSPGVHLIVLNPETGEQEDQKYFDVLHKPESITDFEQYLMSLDTGKIVGITASGMVQTVFTDTIWQCLRHLGSSQQFSGQTAWCILGLTGAKPGQAMVSQGQQYAQLQVPYSIPQVYRFDRIEKVDREEGSSKWMEVDTSNEKVTITRYSPNKIDLKVIVAARGFLVLSETYASGWKAVVDGKSTPIYRANGGLRAIYLPVGPHRITFTYLPPGFITGATLSVISFILLVCLFTFRMNTLYMERKKAKLEQNLVEHYEVQPAGPTDHRDRPGVQRGENPPSNH